MLVKEDNTKASSHEIESNQPDEKNISEDDKNKNGSEVDSNIEVFDSNDVDVANKVDSITSSQSNAEEEDEDEDEEETESDSEVISIVNFLKLLSHCSIILRV